MRAIKKQIEKYYDKRASCQVLGCLMRNPSLLRDKKYILNVEDFPRGNHELLYRCLHNLDLQGLKEVRIADIETYLNTNDPMSYNIIFENKENIEWINGVLEDGSESNYDYYYNKIRKLSLLRNYILEGVDVSDVLNVDEIDHIIIKNQQEEFEKMTLHEIQQYFDKKIFKIKEKFLAKDSSKRRKAGDNAEELREKMKESPVFGYGLESLYLNTLTRGALKGGFFLESRDSGKGKTRVAIERLLLICSPYLWNHEKNDFVINPNGQNNVGLYIGTEMKIYEELEPMIWAFISGVEEYKIKENILTKEEEIRVDKAVQYAKDTNLFLEDEPNYDLATLWNIVDRYKEKTGLDALCIDYLELTVAMTSEYVQLTRGMTAREDQVLLNLSSNIKNMATEYDVVIFGFTQTTDEARRDGVRDQRAIKGARSLPNKADVGITVFAPTKKELELIEPLLKKGRGLNTTIVPNTCYTIYKNRFGKINEEVKIWCYQNLGNMKTIDLFCTNRDYEPMSIDKTTINLIE
jgi:replicative DNA helicase